MFLCVLVVFLYQHWAVSPWLAVTLLLQAFTV